MPHHYFNQNLAAISGDFHTHRLYGEFYDTFGKLIDGFVGNFDLCISMAKALTDWEYTNGGPMAYENRGVTWIEAIENFVAEMLERCLATGSVLSPATVLRQLTVLLVIDEEEKP